MIFKDGVFLKSGLASPYFVTDPDLHWAELTNPRLVVAEKLPPITESALVLCRTAWPALPQMVVAKLRGLSRSAVVATEEVDWLYRLLSTATRAVITSEVTWIWARFKEDPAAFAESEVLAFAPEPLNRAFSPWEKRRREAAAAPFKIPVTPEPGCLDVQVSGEFPKNFSGAVAASEEPKSFDKLSHKFLLAVGVGKIAWPAAKFPLLRASVESLEALTDLAVATQARVLSKDLPMDLDSSCLGRFVQGELRDNKLFFKGSERGPMIPARLRAMNRDYLLAETDAARRAIADRCSRFLGYLDWNPLSRGL